MKRMTLSAIALATLSFGLTGCAKDKPADATTTPATGATSSGPKAVKIAFIPKGNENSFWQVMKAGADKAASEESGVTVAWQPPNPENDITGQINVMQTQVTSGANGIALVAVDGNALVQPTTDAVAKGIPVVTVDSGINETAGQEKTACYIATDNVEGGRRAGKALAEAMGDKGNVGLLFFKRGAVSNDQREQGFKEELAKHPGVKLVAELQANDAADALSKATNMLIAHPDLTGIFAANEPMGVGAANYLRQNKLAGKIKLVAFDASPDEVNGLNDGTINALIVQDPYQMGYLGVKAVLKAIRKQPIDKRFVDSGVSVISKANENTPESQKLLNPLKK